MAEMQAYPLCWPEGWKRMAFHQRKSAQFRAKGSTRNYSSSDNVTVAIGVGRVLEQLERMGIDRQDVIVSTNVRTRLDGLPRSGEAEPVDPGAAVYWRPKRNNPETRCMAIDRYDRVAGNLAAIAATLEAMRAIARHGGAEILNRAFTGFSALPATTEGESYWDVLGISAHATESGITAAYRERVRTAHPDAGGSDDAIRQLNIARDQALSVVRGKAGA